MHPPTTPAAPASTQICCSSSAPSAAQYQLKPTPCVLVYWGALHFCFGMLFWCKAICYKTTASGPSRTWGRAPRSRKRRNWYVHSRTRANFKMMPLAGHGRCRPSRCRGSFGEVITLELSVSFGPSASLIGLTSPRAGPSLSLSLAHRISLRSDSGRTGQCRHGRHSEGGACRDASV